MNNGLRVYRLCGLYNLLLKSYRPLLLYLGTCIVYKRQH